MIKWPSDHFYRIDMDKHVGRNTFSLKMPIAPSCTFLQQKNVITNPSIIAMGIEKHPGRNLTTHPREIQLILTHFQYIPKNDLHRICSVINSEPITCPICWNWMYIYKILQFFLIVYIQPWLGILVVSLTLVNHILYLTFYQIKLNGITDTFIHFVEACFYRKGGEWEGGGGQVGRGDHSKTNLCTSI